MVGRNYRRFLNAAKLTAVIVLLLLGSRTWAASEASVAQEPCGSWEIQATTQADDRITAEIVNSGSGQDCRGVLKIKNNTSLSPFGISAFGGYSFAVMSASSNASTIWIPPMLVDGNSPDRTYLLPILDMELHAVPHDALSDTTINLRGEVNLRAYSIDVALFLIRLGLNLSPVPGCMVPVEALAVAAVRGSTILSASTALALSGDIVGSRRELIQVIDEFYEVAGDALVEVGIDCAGDALVVLSKEILKKAVLTAKIAADYIAWIPVFMFDYFKYQGRSISINVMYTTPEPIVAETELIKLVATGFRDGELTGHCWTSSLVLWRSDAWRCMTEDSHIVDPCLTVTGESLAVACGVSEDGLGTRMSLTEPLPSSERTSDQVHPIWIELADGSFCTFMGGATYAIGNDRMNYICDDGWFIFGDLEPGRVWTANVYRISTSGFVDVTVEESAVVQLRRLWW